MSSAIERLGLTYEEVGDMERKPADLVRDGEYQRVLALIDAMAEGVFV
ncbi:Putative regulatory protein ancestor (Region-BECQ) [Mycobacterium canettii CIPT 140060008]|uniref:Uncharacterized protein n=1 Tax=Mycobacterium canetti TaxID=78331 RepID=A0ABV1ME50_9MYCO|nr:hypothetical protein [Mycobacterium canetti]MBA2786648.1 hypothetical protein [Mycobacterium canetti]CCK51937.1 Putative regulatory protein ancestor (Region-BECQ) [Mycobacterium canettii CIPT 140060008]